MEEVEITKLVEITNTATAILQAHLTLIEISSKEEKRRLLPRYLELKRRRDEAQSALSRALQGQRK
jgi:hypothetical protein